MKKTQKSKDFGNKGIPIKKWINWEIEFNKDASEEDKADAIRKVEKYVLDHYSSQFDKSVITSKVVNFESVISPSAQDRVALTGNVDPSVVFKEAFRTPPLPPPPPPFKLFAPSVIKDIKEFEVSAEQE